eukprot:342224-Prymnesium_polylepis.1
MSADGSNCARGVSCELRGSGTATCDHLVTRTTHVHTVTYCTQRSHRTSDMLGTGMRACRHHNDQPSGDYETCQHPVAKN